MFHMFQLCPVLHRHIQVINGIDVQDNKTMDKLAKDVGDRASKQVVLTILHICIRFRVKSQPPTEGPIDLLIQNAGYFMECGSQAELLKEAVGTKCVFPSFDRAST